MLRDISMSDRTDAFLERAAGMSAGGSSDTAQGSGSAEPKIKKNIAPNA